MSFVIAIWFMKAKQQTYFQLLATKDQTCESKLLIISCN
jgi:hypothetical protein